MNSECVELLADHLNEYADALYDAETSEERVDEITRELADAVKKFRAEVLGCPT